MESLKSSRPDFRGAEKPGIPLLFRAEGGGGGRGSGEEGGGRRKILGTFEAHAVRHLKAGEVWSVLTCATLVRSSEVGAPRGVASSAAAWGWA